MADAAFFRSVGPDLSHAGRILGMCEGEGPENLGCGVSILTVV